MNDTHLHKDMVEGTQREVEAQGTRQECDLCRERSGLPPIADVKRKLEERAQAEGHDTRIPAETLLEDLATAEAQVDELRGLVKQKDADLARLTKELEKATKKLAER